MKTILITGASRGLGFALANKFAQLGWRLIINARDQKTLEIAKQQLVSTTEVIAISGDISDPITRQKIANSVAQIGSLHAIINNASILGPSPQPNLIDYSLDELSKVYQVNLLAPLGIIQVVHKYLVDRAYIINITSDAAVNAYPGWGGYGSSKAALEHLSAILAQENPSWNVYWVDPGDMQTQMHQQAFPGEDISHLPLPRESVPGIIDLFENEQTSGRYCAHS